MNAPDRVGAQDQLILAKLDNLAVKVDALDKKIENEVRDLKTEQIADLRRSFDRLADDQRRLWDRLVTVENDRSRTIGKSGAIQGILVTGASFLSASVAVLLQRLLGGGGPPVHP